MEYFICIAIFKPYNMISLWTKTYKIKYNLKLRKEKLFRYFMRGLKNK